LSEDEEEASRIRLFGEWSYEGISIEDPGLEKYISFKPVYIPHTGGRHEHGRFQKAQVPIVERLVNQLMRPGRAGGNKTRVIKAVEKAFKMINQKTERNPIEILVRGIENSAPREDTTRVSYGGVSYHVSVDVSPQRRVDLALRFISEAARRAAFGSKRSLGGCLAEEIISASTGSDESYAISKKDEMERIAYSSR